MINYNIKSLLFVVIAVLLLDIDAYGNIINMPEKNSYFTGRTTYLHEIQKIISVHGTAYLTGYGGIGKTQLAKEYSYVHEKGYDLIWWFDLRENLEPQYENLLLRLTNDNKFKNLLRNNVKDIHPSVIIDFTNSILSQCGCAWLLIFDNAIDGKPIKLPTTNKALKHNIIVTTREKNNFGNNVLTIGPFADYESERFLFKLHPKEKKEDVYKLLGKLHNYPLALAQISEEMLMYKIRIKEYLSKYNELKTQLIPLRSNITQQYDNTYNEMLNNTLQLIERKNKESADVLYTLALIRTDLPESLLYDIFKNKIKNELTTLVKYGVVQIIHGGNSQILCIHDVIRAEALNRFDRKSTAYKKEIICRLGKYISNFYSEKNFQYLLNAISENKYAPLYDFIDIAIKNNIIDEDVIDAVTIALKLNHTLFNKHGSYPMYLGLIDKIHNKDFEKFLSVSKKALLYANFVYADPIFRSEQNIQRFEREILRLLAILEDSNNFKCLFVVYEQLAQFYLLLGDLRESEKYIKKAHSIIDYTNNMFDLARFWYVYARLCYELRDIDRGLKAYANYEKHRRQILYDDTGIASTGYVKIGLKILAGYKNEAKKELEGAIRNTSLYYNNTPSLRESYLIYTKALLYFQDGQIDLAHVQCMRAIAIAKKAYGEDMLDYHQVNMHIMLGKIYEKREDYNLALEEYRRCIKFYDNRYYGRVIIFYEYGELLSDMSTIYYKQKNYLLSKLYFQRLVLNFGFEHDLVKRLILKLPFEYVYQVGASAA